MWIKFVLIRITRLINEFFRVNMHNMKFDLFNCYVNYILIQLIDYLC